MSGGSHNYLYCADAADIGQRLGALDDMARDLEEICPEAAAATQAVRDHVLDVEPMVDALKDVWFAVEWWQSGDYGHEQAEAAVAKYRAARAATEPALSAAAEAAIAAAAGRRCNTWHRVVIGRRWTGERLFDLLPCALDKHTTEVPHRDPAGNTW